MTDRSRADVWTCKACAQANTLDWGDGWASADGGWCSVGQHSVPRGERIEYVAAPVAAVAPPVATDVATAMPVDDNGQMGLLL